MVCIRDAGNTALREAKDFVWRVDGCLRRKARSEALSLADDSYKRMAYFGCMMITKRRWHSPARAMAGSPHQLRATLDVGLGRFGRSRRIVTCL